MVDDVCELASRWMHHVWCVNFDSFSFASHYLSIISVLGVGCSRFIPELRTHIHRISSNDICFLNWKCHRYISFPSGWNDITFDFLTILSFVTANYGESLMPSNFKNKTCSNHSSQNSRIRQVQIDYATNRWEI